MSNRTPTEPDHTPIFRELDLSAEVRRMWGTQWNAPELAYEFSNGRKFYLRTEDAGIYTGTGSSGVGGFILLEDGSYLLTEDSDRLPLETVP